MSQWFLKNPRLTILVICLILVSGLSSFMLLPRMEDPGLQERIAFVNTFFPGADPSRVESLVTEKIENEMHQIDEIKEIGSSSQEGFSAVSVELRDDVKDTDKVWSKIRDRLDDVAQTLPAGATKPEFVEVDFKAFAMLIAVTWDSQSPANYAVLTRWAKHLEEKIRSIVGTEKIQTFGQPVEEIQVLLDPKQASSLGLTAADVSRQIRNSDSKASAGLIRGPDTDTLIEVGGELESLRRIEQTPIFFGDTGGVVRLGDIAKVEKSIVTPQVDVALVSGKPAVTLGVFVRPGKRIDHWSSVTMEAIEKFKTTLPKGIDVELVFDQNRYVETRLTSLLGNLVIGGAAVFMVILVLMGWRNAIVVSTALPLAGFMVLSSMRLMGIPIHQMSVTGLIIALGLLIDNAIVVVDEVTSKLKKGLSAAEAVSKSVSHLFLPLLGSTLTTAFAFAPIALMPGPAGEFVGSIALNVMVAIASSFFLAMTIIPAITATLNSRESDANVSSNQSWLRDGIYFESIGKAYERCLDFVFHRPWIGIIFGCLAPILGFYQARHLDEQFFPPADRDQIHIEIDLGPQASIDSSKRMISDIRDCLLSKENVLRVDCFAGRNAPSFYYNLIESRRNVSQFAEAIIKLDSGENISATIHGFQEELDLKFPEARVLVRQLEQGPPFEAPIEIRIFGPDLLVLKEIGTDVRQILVDTPGVIHTRSELDETLAKIELSVSEEDARTTGLDLTAIALQVDAWTEGAVGGSIVEATEELRVRVRLNNSQRDNLVSLNSIDLISPQSATNANQHYPGIPLSALADVKLTADFGAIPHLAGRRMNELQVYIPAGVLPSEVLTRIQQRLDATDFNLPEGYLIRYGGEAAERDEAVGNLMANAGVLMVMMIATLVLTFGSFRLAGLIGAVGVLSVGLGVGSLWLWGFPFGFMAIVGTMGLIGVAINDSIVVLAAIRENEAAKNGDRSQIRNSVAQSTRHIISTSLTTMAGFAPLIIAGGGFWPPLAITIAGGVGGATILALIFVPSAYVILKCPKLTEAQSRMVQNADFKPLVPAHTAIEA